MKASRPTAADFSGTVTYDWSLTNDTVGSLTTLGSTAWFTPSDTGSVTVEVTASAGGRSAASAA